MIFPLFFDCVKNSKINLLYFNQKEKISLLKEGEKVMKNEKNIGKKLKYLNPLFLVIPGVNLGFSFLEKMTGKSDASKNQICEVGEGHTTPYVDLKVRSYDAHIDKTYAKTSALIEPIVKEAYSLNTEINIILNKTDNLPDGNDEESRRQRDAAISRKAKDDLRKEEILKRLSEIKAESDMIDESLIHYIERAEGKLNSRIGKYWRGVLSKSSENLKYYPETIHKANLGRKVYLGNRNQLIEMINSSLENGGGHYEAA